MYPLFETIKVVDGQFVNLEWHQKRMDKSRMQVLGNNTRLDLLTNLEIPRQYQRGIVKCRVSYGNTLGSVTYSNYLRKNISALQQVACEVFDYSAKFEDRAKLLQLYQYRGTCDEVLITQNGMVTDTSYSNVVLFDGSRWYTPAKPLLEGTQRANLLAAGTIHETEIHISELANFKKVVLINAMLEFEREDSIPIDRIEMWKGDKIIFTDQPQ